MGLASLGERALDAMAAAVHATRERAVEGQHLYLSGFFAPCREEVTGVDLAVSRGALPVELNGVCVRATAAPPACRIIPGR